jgi:hypothetical protein
MLSATVQDWIVFAIVALAFGSVARRIYRGALAELLASWLLKRGQVSLAMKVKKSASIGKCGGGCDCPAASKQAG